MTAFCPKSSSVWKTIFSEAEVFGIDNDFHALDKEAVKDCVLLDGDSHSDEIFQNLTALLQGKQIDFLFIDSAHTYDITFKELNEWVKWVRKGGIICMHDTSTSWVDCRKALEDYLADKKDKFLKLQFENQNGFTILKKL